MKPFLTTKRKIYELFVLLIFDIVFYFLWSSFDFVILFSLGFIWNWVASQDLSLLLESKRYRFSMLKLVTNLQNLILEPFHKFPLIFRIIIKSLPAGILWFLVIFFNESDMPWWMTFLGSLTFELSQLEMLTFNKQKESSI